MQYHVKRGEEQYGPYSLVEMQEYFRDGRILATDLAKSEALPDWVPVSQILGNIPAAPAVAAPVAIAPQVEAVPLPPNLHWLVLLLLIVISQKLSVLGVIFLWIWAIAITNWARRLNGSNTALILAAIYPLGAFCGGIAIGIGKATRNSAFQFIGLLLIVGAIIGYIIAIFKVRSAMEEYYNSKENIALTLSGVMTFLFGYIYIQYHINRIAKWKQTGVLS